LKYKKIKPKKIYEEVANILLEMIRNGELKPGDKLQSVQQLAVNFQVGRSAIREALTSLRAMGVIEMRQGEGTFVKEFNPDGIMYPLSQAFLMSNEQMEQLLEVRKILETGMVAIAAVKRTDRHLHDIAEALSEMKKAVGNEELGEKADLAFHMAIAKASQNQLLYRLMHHVSDLMAEAMKETRRLLLYSEDATMEKLNEEHERIYQSIVIGDKEAARKAMLQHLEGVEQVLMTAFADEKKKG
jgi:GntR family transcriptional repressor for pyruvate dehydrogenase complex